MTSVPIDLIVLSAVDDMFFSSKIESVAKLVGVQVVHALDARQLEECLTGAAPRMIILDLNSKACAPLGAIRRIKADARFSQAPIVGFLSHVQHELERRAREAGCNQVMPRSSFSADLPRILQSIK
jgi:DNA-binding NarL/FixJ family response regulator